jgi:16S rRNA (guanine966-N2)-methyltransferase
LRIITGEARYRKLKTPKGRNLRPTSDIVKEGLFNIIGNGIRGAKFLDIFAGTGNVGIEAISRGAERTDFLELSREHMAIIKDNLRTCGFTDRAGVHGGKAEQLLAMLASADVKYDYIYADPPYGYEEYGALLEQISKLGLLNEGGSLFLETDRRTVLPEEAGDFAVVREYRYGNTILTLYRRATQKR